MFTEKDKKQFEQWQKQWDAAADQFSKDYADELSKNQQKALEPQSVSWLTNTPMERDYEEKPVEEDPNWRDIYYRSQNIEGLITDSVKYDGQPEKPKAAFGAFTPTKTVPTKQDSTGKDQERDDGNGIRVTPNWSDGPELSELDDIKRRLDDMEWKAADAEIKSEKPSSLRKQIESLRDRVKKISEKINRGPETDVT